MFSEESIQNSGKHLICDITPFNISNADFYSIKKVKSIMANFTPYHTYLP